MAKIPKTKKVAVLSLTSTMTRGKYVCFPIDNVIMQDPEYIQWCIDKWENFELDNEAYEKFTRYYDMKKTEKFNY